MILRNISKQYITDFFYVFETMNARICHDHSATGSYSLSVVNRHSLHAHLD